MDEWSEKVKGIVTQHNKRKNDIQNVFTRILDDRKIGVSSAIELLDKNNLVWDITISDKNFQLSNEEILEAQSDCIDGRKNDLEEMIKSLILGKLQNPPKKNYN